MDEQTKAQQELDSGLVAACVILRNLSRAVEAAQAAGLQIDGLAQDAIDAVRAAEHQLSQIVFKQPLPTAEDYRPPPITERPDSTGAGSIEVVAQESKIDTEEEVCINPNIANPQRGEAEEAEEAPQHQVSTGSKSLLLPHQLEFAFDIQPRAWEASATALLGDQREAIAALQQKSHLAVESSVNDSPDVTPQHRRTQTLPSTPVDTAMATAPTPQTRSPSLQSESSTHSDDSEAYVYKPPTSLKLEYYTVNLLDRHGIAFDRLLAAPYIIRRDKETEWRKVQSPWCAANAMAGSGYIGNLDGLIMHLQRFHAREMEEWRGKGKSDRDLWHLATREVVALEDVEKIQEGEIAVVKKRFKC